MWGNGGIHEHDVDENQRVKEDTQMIRFDFLGTTRGGYARCLIDDKLKEELKCFRCTLIERCVIETIQ